MPEGIYTSWFGQQREKLGLLQISDIGTITWVRLTAIRYFMGWGGWHLLHWEATESKWGHQLKVQRHLQEWNFCRFRANTKAHSLGKSCNTQQPALTFQTDPRVDAQVGLTYILSFHGCVLCFLLSSESRDEEKKYQDCFYKIKTRLWGCSYRGLVFERGEES